MSTKRKWVTILRKLLMVVLVLLVIAAGLFFYHNEVTKNTDEYLYGLPYAIGDRHRVVQGYGGLFSHSHIAALDFEMAVGTAVHAAREGTVYSYRDNSNEGGMGESYKNKANYLIIRHDDGSFGCYWHLAQHGVLIRSGRVNRGQQVAISGATGLVIRPHLHFSVKRKLSYDMDSFVQTRFLTTEGSTLLSNGSSYQRP